MDWKDSITNFVKFYQENYWICENISKELIWDIIRIGSYDIRNPYLYIYFPKTHDETQYVLTINIPEGMEYSKFRDEVSKFIKNRGDNMIVKIIDISELNNIVISQISKSMKVDYIIKNDNMYDFIKIDQKIIQFAKEYNKYDINIPGFSNHEEYYKFAHDFYYEIIKDIRNNHIIFNSSLILIINNLF